MYLGMLVLNIAIINGPEELALQFSNRLKRVKVLCV